MHVANVTVLADKVIDVKKTKDMTYYQKIKFNYLRIIDALNYLMVAVWAYLRLVFLSKDGSIVTSALGLHSFTHFVLLFITLGALVGVAMNFLFSDKIRYLITTFYAGAMSIIFLVSVVLCIIQTNHTGFVIAAIYGYILTTLLLKSNKLLAKINTDIYLGKKEAKQ